MGHWGRQSRGWAGFLRHRASLGERGLMWGHAHMLARKAATGQVLLKRTCAISCSGH